MHEVLATVARHGLAALGLAVFLEAIGLPVPAALALLAAGAACAWHTMRPDAALAVAMLAMLAGDILLFFVGRYSGWQLLGILCRLAANPETCILTSADSFYRRGRTTLVVAKFIPAINTMAPPLAGSMRMRFTQFLWLDAAGALLYIGVYGIGGYLFSDFLSMITHGFETASRALSWLVGVGMVAYVAYHAVLYWKHRVYRVVPRVQVSELLNRLEDAKESERVMIADVRSHGYYDPGAERIRGSIRLEPNHLMAAMEALPKDKEIYLYCT